MTPWVTAEQIVTLVNWLYRFLLNAVGAIAIVFVVALLVGQELMRAYRDPSQPDPDPVINSTTIVPLLIAFLILALVHVLRILQLL